MRKLLLLLVLLFAGLAGAAYWVSVESPGDVPAPRTAAAEYGPLVETVSASGVLQPWEALTVAAEVAGKVIEVAADFNQVVSEGDLLFRLDDRAAWQKLRQAEAAVDLARAEVDRARAATEPPRRQIERLRGLSDSVVVRPDMDLAEAQLRAAQAAVEAAEVRVKDVEAARDLARLGIHQTRACVPVVQRPTPAGATAAAEAPRGLGIVSADGPAQPRRKYIVLDRKVEVNQVVAPGTAPAFVLAADLARLQLVVPVAESDIGRVRRGQQATFTVAAGDDVSHPARVVDLRLLPASDHGAVSYKVVLDVANAQDAQGEWRLRPGMTASVDLAVRRRGPAWKVPLAALNLEMPAEHVSPEARAHLDRWRAQPDRADWQPVWALRPDGRPRPVLVRLGGVDADGERGARDDQAAEVLAWDPELRPRPNSGEPFTAPRLLLDAPAPRKTAWFQPPRIKL